jgi:hypothetical protein
MSGWTPATKNAVARAIDEIAAHAGAEIWSHYSKLMIDPYRSKIERFGEVGEVFVVAKLPCRVVFFEDIEEEFGTACELDGKLVDCAFYGDLRLALTEAAAGR